MSFRIVTNLKTVVRQSPYCEEISYGSWGCTYSVPDHFDRPSSNGGLESYWV